jgi:Zn-dependent alcohol dehydrogenase
LDVRAAVAFEAGKKLSIETAQLDGPKEGDDLITHTHTLPLERINEGFDLMARGESIRSVVVY